MRRRRRTGREERRWDEYGVLVTFMVITTRMGSRDRWMIRMVTTTAVVVWYEG